MVHVRICDEQKLLELLAFPHVQIQHIVVSGLRLSQCPQVTCLLQFKDEYYKVEDMGYSDVHIGIE